MPDQDGFYAGVRAPTIDENIVLGPAMRVRGRVVHHVKDKRSSQYYRVGVREYLVLSLLDGRHTFADIAQEHLRVFGRDMTPAAWGQILQMARSRSMISAPLPAPTPRAGAKLPRFSHNKYWAFYLRFLSPQAFLKKLDANVGWLYTWPFTVTLFLVIMVAESYVALHIFMLARAMHMTLGRHPPSVLIGFGVIAYASLIMHEMAHGLTCIHYGGEVDDMGIMFRYCTFFPYCKLDDLIVMPRIRHRVAVVLSGTIASLIVMVPFVGLFILSPKSSFAWSVSALMLTIYNIVSCANLLPFLQLDGYLLLSTCTRRPQLQQEAKDRLMEFLRLKTSGSTPKNVPWETRLYVSYAATSLLLTACFIFYSLMRWHSILSKFTSQGRAWALIIILLTCSSVVWLLAKRRRNHADLMPANGEV